MPPSLPPELLDIIADHSCDEPTTLKTCCLLSKSWIQRTRRHLFAHVAFDSQQSSGRSIESWMDTFPDPSSSPAHHTRSLAISGLPAIASATTEGIAWVRSFNSIVELAVDTRFWADCEVSLVQLHGLSPVLKSLRVDHGCLPLSEVFSLTCSFPLLEDLSLHTNTPPPRRCFSDLMDAPLTSPKLTGTLLLTGNVPAVMGPLLNLSGGLRFANITTECDNNSFGFVVDLVSKCSDTLESLCIGYFSPVAVIPRFDLSKVTKLRDLELRWNRLDVRWITTLIKTVESPHLRQITVLLSFWVTFVGPAEERIRRGWQGLDRLLVKLWTSRSILPKIRYEKERSGGVDDLGVLVKSLLPELTRWGAVGMVE